MSHSRAPDVHLEEGELRAAIWFGHATTRANPSGMQASISLDRWTEHNERRYVRKTFRAGDVRGLQRLLERVKMELECHAEHERRIGPMMRARQREQTRREAIARGRA